jgi:hypothetical protein
MSTSGEFITRIGELEKELRQEVDRSAAAQAELDEAHATLERIWSSVANSGLGIGGKSTTVGAVEHVVATLAAAQAEAKRLREALEDVLNATSGSKKRCGHDFTCVCPWDNARAALAGEVEE